MGNIIEGKKNVNRFSAIILAVIILAGAALSVSMYYVIQKSFFQASVAHEMELMSIMEHLGNIVMDFRLKTVKTEVKSISEQYGELIQSSEDKERTKLLDSIKHKEDVLGYCYYSGEKWFSDGEDYTSYAAGLDISKVWMGETLVMSPDFDKADHYLMAVATPVWTDSRKREVAGVLLELRDGYSISRWMEDLFLPMDLGTAYIINGEGRNIATAREENYDWITTRYNAQDLAAELGDEVSKSVAQLEKRALDGETGVDTYLWEEGTSYVAYGPLTETDWAFFIGFYGIQFEKYTKDNTNISIRIAGLLSMVFILIIGIVVAVLSHSLNKERSYSRILQMQKEEMNEQALQIAASEERFRIAMQRSRDVIMEYQLESGEVTSFYGSMEIKSGKVGDGEFRKRMREDWHMDEISIERFEEVIHAIRKGMTSAECFLSGERNGEHKWYKLSVTAIPNGSYAATRAVGILQDVTSEHEAEMDSLTKLLNKSTMTENIRKLMRKNQIETLGAFVMLDIDYFKNVNDTYGHPVGDEVLYTIAQILKEVFPEPYMTARFGGDEFCIYCSCCADAQELKKRMKELAQKAKSIEIKDCENLHITLSIGAVLFQGKTEFEDIYKKADEMLYEVKEAGRDGYRIFEQRQAENI